MFRHERVGIQAMRLIGDHVVALKVHKRFCGQLVSEHLQKSPVGGQIACDNVLTYLYYFKAAIAAWLKKNPSAASQVKITDLLTPEELKMLPYIHSDLYDRVQAAKREAKAAGEQSVKLSQHKSAITAASAAKIEKPVHAEGAASPQQLAAH